MSDLIIPGSASPANLHLKRDVRAVMVESDLYDICERIKEIDPSLYIVQLEEDDRCAFAVMERCSDGIHRLVSKHKELDKRVLDKMLYLRAVPFEKRFNEIEAQVDKEEEDQRLKESEELYEKLGRPMLTQFAHDGFIDRNISYPKRGVALRGKLR